MLSITAKSLRQRSSMLGFHRLSQEIRDDASRSPLSTVERDEVDRFNYELEFTSKYHTLSQQLSSLAALGMRLKTRIEDRNRMQGLRPPPAKGDAEAAQRARTEKEQHDSMMQIMNDLMVGSTNMKTLQTKICDLFYLATAQHKAGTKDSKPMANCLQALTLLLDVTKASIERANIIFQVTDDAENKDNGAMMDWTQLSQRITQYNSALVAWVSRNNAALPDKLQAAHKWIRARKPWLVGGIIALTVIGGVVAAILTMGGALLAGGAAIVASLLTTKVIVSASAACAGVSVVSSVAAGSVYQAGKQVSIEQNSRIIRAIDKLTTANTTSNPCTLDAILQALDASHTSQIQFNEFLRVSLDVCAVCHGELLPSQMLARPQHDACQHIFHSECLKAVEPKRCPCCRRDYRDVENLRISPRT
eukprot:TRINITY_DN14826_c0_g1_i1.p1 TRINITY_DN14826_c0_g1~~TRINITY_DN14826_c0_g1_i1.p1  ORF type:complete len:419 (+),score=83.87 TRINITY_DN14826_c0_g1_i1:724-1980(+)